MMGWRDLKVWQKWGILGGLSGSVFVSLIYYFDSIQRATFPWNVFILAPIIILEATIGFTDKRDFGLLSWFRIFIYFFVLFALLGYLIDKMNKPGPFKSKIPYVLIFLLTLIIVPALAIISVLLFSLT